MESSSRSMIDLYWLFDYPDTISNITDGKEKAEKKLKYDVSQDFRIN